MIVRSEDEVQSLTRGAIHTALSGRPGPVYLEVSTDLLDRPASGSGKEDSGKGDEGEGG